MKILSAIYRYLPVVLTLCLGVGLSTLASVSMGKWERENNQLQFQRRTEALSVLLQSGFEQYTQTLSTLGNFYRSSKQVDVLQLQNFVSSTFTTQQGVQALGLSDSTLSHISLITLLPQSSLERQKDVELLEKLLREFKRSPTVSKSRSNSPDKNSKASNLKIVNLTVNTQCRSAFETARDSGKFILTSCFNQNYSLQPPFKITVIVPVYQTDNAPQDLPSRRQAIRGYVLGVFQVSKIVEEILAKLNYGIDFYIYINQNELSQPLGIYKFSQHKLSLINSKQNWHPLSSKNLCNQPDICTRSLEVWQQQWSILFLPNQGYTSFEPRRGAEAMLAIGLLLTASPFVYLAMLMAWIDREREVRELKLRLFSTASHEFRTPLSTILLSAQLLEDSSHDWSVEKKLKNLARIQSAAKSMNYMLTDMLTLSRAEAGKLEFSPELTNLSDFCHDLVEDIKLLYEAKQNIVIHCSSGKYNTAYVDKKLLTPILSNLLANAIKYSAADRMINLRLNCSNKNIIFEVEDCGIGIPAVEQLKIYEAFYRTKDVENFDGTGLGLAVVKTCVELHQGQIFVDSKVGVGTVFQVVIPTVDV